MNIWYSYFYKPLKNSIYLTENDLEKYLRYVVIRAYGLIMANMVIKYKQFTLLFETESSETFSVSDSVSMMPEAWQENL